MTRHLIHIGFPKAGSTFLQKWFSLHPDLQYQEGAIAGYYTIFELVRSVAQGVSDPAYVVTSTEALSVPLPTWGLGLYFPHGAALPLPIPVARQHVCGLLKAIFPNAKVLIVTRGFRSALYSLYSQFVREGGSATFEEWIERPRLEWQYGETIAFYREAFPNEVIVLPYELLASNHRAFLDNLSDALGLEKTDLDIERQNAGLNSAELRWYPRLAAAFKRIPYIRRSFYKAFVPLSFGNRLRYLIRVLDYFFPSSPVTMEDIPDHVIKRFEGLADILKDEPAYRDYRDAYLIRA